MFEYDETNQKLGEGMAASRHCTIAFFFEHTYNGAPPLFNYTGKTVVGLKAWEKAKIAELARVKTLAGVWAIRERATRSGGPKLWRRS